MISCSIVIVLYLSSTSVAALSRPNGDDSCPCVSSNQIEPAITQLNLTEILGPLVNVESYGFGCDSHDRETLQCMPYGSDSSCEDTIPRASSCDREWCGKEWCFVDPSNCSIAHTRSNLGWYGNRYYSYATCGNVDRFVKDGRIEKLMHKTFRVGYNSNTGGFDGAFSRNGHFSVSGWEGPLVDFFKKAACEGKFVIKRSRPPEHLVENSATFFSGSPFDTCVYATSLGYLDFCVALYTITNERAASGTFFTLMNSPIFLVVFTENADSSNSIWGNVGNVFRPFTPGTWFWIFFGVVPIMSFLISFHESGLGFVICVKRTRATEETKKAPVAIVGNAPASTVRAKKRRRVKHLTRREEDTYYEFQNKSRIQDKPVNFRSKKKDDFSRNTLEEEICQAVQEEVRIQGGEGNLPSEKIDDISRTTACRDMIDGGESDCEEMRNRSMIQEDISNQRIQSQFPYHISRMTICVRRMGDSLFRGFHGVFSQAYDDEGRTVGGGLTILGMGFFILTIISLYTANLAAILTETARTTPIDSLEEAIKARYTFCGERKVMQTVLSSYDIPQDLIIPDPEDGKPGFNCATCAARRRTFDFMVPNYTDSVTHCNAGLSVLPTLQQLQAEGHHCNKTVIGAPIAYTDVGIPVYDGIAKEMIAFLQGLKMRGIYESLIREATPESRCLETGSEGMSLSITHLSGVWFVTSSFAIAGLIAKVSGSFFSAR